MGIHRALCLAVASLPLVSAQNAAEDPQCVSYTGAYPMKSVIEIQSSYTQSTINGNCFPSTYDGQFVTVTGTVSAVGATKNSYTAGYFYIQDCEDNSACELFSAIEVFHEDHADNLVVGDIVEVKGYVQESSGDTLLVACLYTKTGEASVKVVPMTVTTSTFPMPYHPDTNPNGQACTAEAEGYEHMLVTVTSPVVQCCSQAHGYIDGSSYDDRCQGNIDVNWAPVWDVYKQFYVTTKGEDNSLLDIDNHLFSTFTKYYTRCDDSFNQADEFISITGVVDWWNGDGDESPRWDVAPRNQFDIEGATPIDTTKVQDRKIREIKNALFPQIMWGNEFDSMPANLLGTNEINPEGVQGLGCDGADGTGLFSAGSCPRSDVRTFCDFYPHAICNCYPMNTYSSVASAGSEYMYFQGVVTHVQDPTGPFYMEDGCGVGNGVYMYRNDADQSVQVGDEVRTLAKVYHYYGLDELTDPIEVAVLSRNNILCEPTVITAAPFQSMGHGDCNIEAEVIEGSRVKMEGVTVTKIFNSRCMEDDPDVVNSGMSFVGGWSSRFCPDACPQKRCWGAFLQSYFDSSLSSSLGFGDTYTAIEITDKDGNSMVLDQARNDQSATPLTPYYLGTVPGYENQTLKVGDTFSYVIGYVDHRRGSYKFDYGASTISARSYYAFIVKEIGGWNMPDGPEEDDDDSSGLSGGALIGVIVACVVVVVVLSFLCLYLGAKYHRVVERAEPCKPTDDPNAKLELMSVTMPPMSNDANSETKKGEMSSEQV